MSRIAYAMGLLVGVIFAFAAYVAVTNSLSVTATTSVSNPLCSIPIVGFACSIGLAPATLTQAYGFTVQGLGLIVTETMLFFFVILAVSGFFLLLLFRRQEGGTMWAWAVSGLVLGFLAVSGFLLGGVPIQTCANPLGLCVYYAWYYTVAGVVFLLAAIALWMRSGSGRSALA